MEIVKYNPQQASNNRAKNKAVTVTVRPQPQSAQPRRRRNRQRARNSYNGASSLASHLYNGIMYPDLYGPIRVPLPGDVSKTVLGMDRTHLDLPYSATNAAQLIIASGSSGPSYNGAATQLYTAATGAANWAAGSSALASNQFPAGTQVSECRLVGISITLYYTGAPLNVTGEVILGTIPASAIASLTSTNFSSMYYLPGVMKMPIADLVNKPFRTSGTHYSPDSWSFVSPNVATSDVEVPFFATSAMASGGIVGYEVTRTWEIKPTIITGQVIPFEASASGRAADDSVFTNVLDSISKITTSVTEGIPPLMRPMLQGISDALPQIVQTSTRATMNLAAATAFRALQTQGVMRNNNGRLPFRY